jgi:endogenous inhibitor of DNA gyrase (YacG/DUF329 family)
MPELEVECPECGERVGTGVYEEPESFENTYLAHHSTNCSNCGRIFEWGKSDVVNMP